MRRLGYLSIIVIVLSILLAGSLAVGTRRVTAIDQFASEQCSPQPCWHGIRPGHTSLDEAKTILKADASSGTPNDYQVCYEANGCWSLSLMSYSADSHDPVHQLAFQPSPGAFSLGDALTMYGSPISSQLCYIAAPTNGDLGPEVQRPVMVGYLTFRGNIKVITYSRTAPLERRFDPNMDVYRLYYQVGYDIFSPRWRGFSEIRRLGCTQG